ncbi:hypothetical protein QBC46DRAFT_2870 [Diplogelasinospora grovesii]|uniref:C2H2-type domain-containing protein n=1 Tax=Diplogelasinospora grovesii TaxID=303347 RepID=A0AAN6NI13_9PEZI|nr:hypothetical protein QBC46DRAFT_2870 [Diplogelasinospora grovesii]
MDHLTPPSLTRSPSTPSNTYCPSERSSLDYPSPGLVDQQYKISSIYEEPACSGAPSMDPEMSLPQPEQWGHASVLHHPASSASGMPSILSGEYDTFGSYHYGHHEVYHHHSPHSSSHHHAHSSPLPSSTPPPTGGAGAPRSPGHQSRTSVTSYPPVTSMPVGAMTPRVKMETQSDYGPGSAAQMEMSHYPSPRSIHTPFNPSDNGAYSTASGGYLSDGGSSGCYQPGEAEQHNFYPPPHQTSPFLDGRRPTYRIAAAAGARGGPRRAPRRLTTKEEANFQCEVKGCGKLFSRSYNFKAHMETHDEKREYPFPCSVADCNKKFVRKTDLQRHHQSVHMKERNHKCDYCGRLFARKDTLRRHMEDGCSKRFDIGTLDLRATDHNANVYDPLIRPMGGGQHQHHAHHHLLPHTVHHSALPPMAIPPLASSSTPPAIRSLTAGGGDHQSQQHHWGR